MITYEEIKKANESITPTQIKGKDYVEVNKRITAFRMCYPDGFILTSLDYREEDVDDGICIFSCKVGYYNSDGSMHVLGTGTAYEKENSSFINETSYIENCETSAVGRALGMAGFGIDTSVASAEEVQTAIMNQNGNEPFTYETAKNFKMPFGKYKGKTLSTILSKDEKYIDWIAGKTDNQKVKEAIILIRNHKPEDDKEV